MFILGVQKQEKNAVCNEGEKLYHLQGFSVNDVKELFPYQFMFLAQKILREVYIL